MPLLMTFPMKMKELGCAISSIARAKHRYTGGWLNFRNPQAVWHFVKKIQKNPQAVSSWLRQFQLKWFHYLSDVKDRSSARALWSLIYLISTVFTPWKFHSISGKTQAILSEAECGNPVEISPVLDTFTEGSLCATGGHVYWGLTVCHCWTHLLRAHCVPLVDMFTEWGLTVCHW